MNNFLRCKFYSDLCLKSLANRRFYRWLIAFYKIVNKMTSHYLTDYLPTQDLDSINPSKITAIYPLDGRTERFPNSFSPYCIFQWNNLDSLTKESPIHCYFQTFYFWFYMSCPYNNVQAKQSFRFCYVHSVEGGFSHLREYKFRHKLLDIVDPICYCYTNIVENTYHS